jgi:Flp pilus assembly protein TadB
MPIGAQPKGARGTVGHPYSALNLRLALAVFGLVCCALLTVGLLRVGNRPLALVVGALAVVSLVDLVVIQLRRRQARRTHRESGSLFG